MRTGPARLLLPEGSFSKTPRVAPSRAGTRRACSSTARPPATTHRQTNRAAPSSGLEFERVRAALVHQKPTLDLQQVAAARVGETADAARGDHAVAGDHDRQLVVAAGLAHGARRVKPGVAQLAREFTVGERAAARNRAHCFPDAALKIRALDEERQVEFRVGILAVALELARGALRELVLRRLRLHARRQI